MHCRPALVATVVFVSVMQCCPLVTRFVVIIEYGVVRLMHVDDMVVLLT
jgi:hypothetical protein